MEDADGHGAGPGRPQGPRRHAGHRRLRDRLLVADLPEALPGQHAEDRPGFRRWSGSGRLRHRHRPSVIDLAHALGLTVVAEGVETAEQADPAPPAGLRPRPGLLPVTTGAGQRLHGLEHPERGGPAGGHRQERHRPRLTHEADVGREVLAGEGGAGGDEVGGGALEDDPAAVVAGAGAEVDDPVGVRHDRLVVLDDDDRLAGVDEPVEQAEQLLDVGEVEAGGRLVEDVDAALLGHVGGQLEPLPLAAGQRGERLAEAEVAEPDVGEPVEDGVRGRRARLAGAEELLGLGHRHREHLADVAAAEVVLQHRRLEPLPLALLAGGGDAGHHRQVGVDDAGAVAGGAGALGVGAEQRRLHAVGLRERLADRVEQPGVRRRVAPSRAADRALVDRHHARAGGDRPVHERALAGAGDAGDDDQHPERDVDVDVAAGCGAVAPRISSVPVGVRTVSLRAARSSRWRPVMVPLARSPSTVPSKQTVPPAVPAPGPRSTTWSAIAIVSGSCSTTSTVLPLSRSRSSRSFIRWMSWGCRPMVGSSKT